MDDERAWWVVCEDSKVGPYTRARAERELEEIERLTSHPRFHMISCPYKHEVVYEKETV